VIRDWQANGRKKPGRKPLEIRNKWIEYFGLSPVNARHMRAAFCDQLDACKDDDARRVLLGIGRKKEQEP
jgi:hypothetical protein